MSFKFLKGIDIFSQPIQTFVTSRDKKTNQKSFSTDHGSILGGLVTIICAITTFTYLALEITKMCKGQNDNYVTVILSNDNRGDTEVLMKDNSFYPFIQIKNMHDDGYYKDLNIFQPGIDDEGNHITQLNMDELKRYIQPQVTLHERSLDNDKRYTIPFRNCRASDFTQRKFTRQMYGQIMCPDFDNYEELLKIKNEYYNTNRTSFSVDIFKCQGDNCYPEHKIDKLLDSIYFNLETLAERVECSSFHQGIPVKTTQNYHSQFQLSQITYRDSNNFLRVNIGEVQESRFLPFSQSNYEFIDLISGPTWTGKQFKHERLYSEDQGTTWQTQEKTQLFGAYFFLSQDIKTHQQTLYMYLDLASDFGGLYQSFVLAFYFMIGSKINNSIIMMKLIRGTLYTRKSNIQTKNEVTNMNQIQFTTREKCRILFNQFCPSKSKNKQYYAQVFEKGQLMIQTELNMFTILESILKIRASLAVIIGDDKHIITKIQNTYLETATVQLDLDYVCTKSEFQHFLERDERQIIRSELQKKIINKLRASMSPLNLQMTKQRQLQSESSNEDSDTKIDRTVDDLIREEFQFQDQK